MKVPFWVQRSSTGHFTCFYQWQLVLDRKQWGSQGEGLDFFLPSSGCGVEQPSHPLRTRNGVELPRGRVAASPKQRERDGDRGAGLQEQRTRFSLAPVVCTFQDLPGSASRCPGSVSGRCQGKLAMPLCCDHTRATLATSVYGCNV